MMFETKYENDVLYIFINNKSEVTFRPNLTESVWKIMLSDGYYTVWKILNDYEEMIGADYNFSEAYKFAKGLS